MDCIFAIFFFLGIIAMLIGEYRKYRLNQNIRSAIKSKDDVEYRRLSKINREWERREAANPSDQDYLNAIMSLDAAEHGVFFPGAEDTFSKLDNPAANPEYKISSTAKDIRYKNQNQNNESLPTQRSGNPSAISIKLATQETYKFKTEKPGIETIVEGTLLQTQSEARQLSEDSGEVVEIFERKDDDWVWVDKIFPSNEAFLRRRGSPVRQPEVKPVKRQPNICPKCGAVLEYIMFDDEPVLLTCPNGHDI